MLFPALGEWYTNQTCIHNTWYVCFECKKGFDIALFFSLQNCCPKVQWWHSFGKYKCYPLTVFTKLISNVIVVQGGSSKRQLSSKTWALMNGPRALIKGFWGMGSFFLTLWLCENSSFPEDMAAKCCGRSRKTRFSLITDNTHSLIWNLLAPRSVRNEFLLFVNGECHVFIWIVDTNNSFSSRFSTKYIIYWNILKGTQLFWTFS